MDRKSPLTVASTAGNHRIAAALLRAGANGDFRAGQAASPCLVLAVREGHRAVAEELIRAHCDVNLTNDRGLAAVNMAANFNKQELLDLLIGAGADCSLPGVNGASFPIGIASHRGHTKIIESLVRAQVDCNQRTPAGETAVRAASTRGHLDVVRALIRAQADVNVQSKDGCSALWIACQNGHHEVVAALIQARADVNAQTEEGVTPLYIAAQHGHHRIVAELVGAQAQVDMATNKGEVPLYMASAHGHLRVVETLVKSCADPDIQQREGASSVQAAALQGHRMLVDTLIRARADVDAKDVDGVAPILMAAQNGHQPVVQQLIDAGADVNAQTREEGKTPLFVAAQLGRDGIVDALIRAHADVNRANIRGSTPLFVAAQNGHRRTVELLLRSRADASRCNISLRTPQKIALESGHYGVARLLADAAGAGRVQSSSIDPNHFKFLFLRGKTQEALAALEGGGRPAPLDSRRCDELLEECIQLQEQLSRQRTAEQAQDRLPAESPGELSLRLHSAMTRSGFKQSRAALQSAAADVLQQIARRLFNMEEIFVVGSFSEGWGNSLVRLDGRTDADSDIDVTQFFQSNHFHISGKCQCATVDPGTRLEYENGHMKWRGLPASPAKPLRGSSLKPAIDSVSVHRCCAYPTIHILQEEGWCTQMPLELLQSLRQELVASSCHLATAAPPGEEGNFLRVSTTFLERRLMRSLGDVQGQVFILLKYLIKKVISTRVSGLKSYHAKTIIFYMLEEQPAQDWQPSNLVELTRRALQKLLHHLLESGAAGNECMRHFFMRDAIVYLKKGAKEKAQAAQVVAETLGQLDQLLVQFMDTLQPLTSGIFYFHPFLVLPGLAFEISPVKSNTAGHLLEYHEIYKMVISLVHRLAQGDGDATAVQSITADIDRIPDCAFSAREGLRVMACLQQGRPSEACQALRSSRDHSVSRGMTFEASGSTAEGASFLVDQVWQHLRGADCAWKFFFRSEKRPELDFLPQAMRWIFPLQMRNYRTYFYLNFDALLRCLRIELLKGEQCQETCWLEELLQSGCMDPQELLVGLQHCSDRDVDLVARLVQAHTDTIEEYPELLLTANRLMEQMIGLKEAATVRTLTKMKEELRRSLRNLSGSAT